MTEHEDSLYFRLMKEGFQVARHGNPDLEMMQWLLTAHSRLGTEDIRIVNAESIDPYHVKYKKGEYVVLYKPPNKS